MNYTAQMIDFGNHTREHVGGLCIHDLIWNFFEVTLALDLRSALSAQTSVRDCARHATVFDVSVISKYWRGDLLDRVYFVKTRIFQQTEASNAKDCMEDINHIPWPVCKTS
jgi:hypothetical protein